MQDELKLIALDAEDLGVVSAHLQDAVVKVSDIAYRPKENRFALLLNRFNWAGAMTGPKPDQSMTRHRCALRIERVIAARTQAIDLTEKDNVMALLAIQYEQLQDDDPKGHITFVFSGGGAIQLDVECIEAELRDLGGAWATNSRPDHSDDESAV